jgi:hypothetical protein
VHNQLRRAASIAFAALLAATVSAVLASWSATPAQDEAGPICWHIITDEVEC